MKAFEQCFSLVFNILQAAFGDFCLDLNHVHLRKNMYKSLWLLAVKS